MKRILAIGVILLFIGVCVLPLSADISKEKSSKEEHTSFEPLSNDEDFKIILLGMKGKNDWFTSCILIFFIYNETFPEKIWFSITPVGVDPEWQIYTEFFEFCDEGWWIFRYKWLDIYGEMHYPPPIEFGIDLTPPEVDIIKPKLERLYLFGLKLFRIRRNIPLMIGKGSIKVYAYDKVSGVNNVTFILSLDDVIVNYLLGKKDPYELRLKGRYKGTYNLFVEVEDVAGLTGNITRDIEIIKYGFL